MGQRGWCSDLHLGCRWAFATDSFVSRAVVSFATQANKERRMEQRSKKKKREEAP